MATVYVQRSQQGAIVGMFGARQPGLAEEAIDERTAEAAAFRDRADPPRRDLAAELDAVKADVARARAAEAVLIEKAIVSKGEIDAKVPAIDVAAVKG